MLSEAEQVLAVPSTLAVWEGLHQQSTRLEKAVTKRLQHPPAYEQLLTVEGIGEILAQTIVLETGNLGRFPSVGDYAAYCRGVRSIKRSNGKRKGQGNGKNGQPYLAWASSPKSDHTTLGH